MSNNRLIQPTSQGDNTWIAPNAVVLGQVHLGSNCTVWYGAVLRGDNDSICIGDGTNIQDNAVIHVDEEVKVAIGKDCIIGHSAVVHGATLGNNVMIGIHATVLNRVVIGDYCIIGSNSLVPEGMNIPAGSLVLGTPAKVVRKLTDADFEKLRNNAKNYQILGMKMLTHQ